MSPLHPGEILPRAEPRTLWNGLERRVLLGPPPNLSRRPHRRQLWRRRLAEQAAIVRVGRADAGCDMGACARGTPSSRRPAPIASSEASESGMTNASARGDRGDERAKGIEALPVSRRAAPATNLFPTETAESE